MKIMKKELLRRKNMIKQGDIYLYIAVCNVPLSLSINLSLYRSVSLSISVEESYHQLERSSSNHGNYRTSLTKKSEAHTHKLLYHSAY